MAKLTFNLMLVVTGLMVFEVSPHDIKDALTILVAEICLAFVSSNRAIYRYTCCSQEMNTKTRWPFVHKD